MIKLELTVHKVEEIERPFEIVTCEGKMVGVILWGDDGQRIPFNLSGLNSSNSTEEALMLIMEGIQVIIEAWAEEGAPDVSLN